MISDIRYIRLKWDLGSVIEYEYHYRGRYGAPGEKRASHRKATPEQMEKQNRLNREKKVRRTILLNFDENDLWTCLKYPAGSRLPIETVKQHFRKFCNAMRRAYKKANEPFKFIYRMEVGSSGGVHIHILVNRLRGEVNTDRLMSRLWKEITSKDASGAALPPGYINYTPLYESGGYEALAKYLVKNPRSGEYEQLSLFPEEERKDFVRYNSSRNLKRPVPEKREYRRWTLRRLIDEGPKPSKGYYIDKNSIVSGINRYTGMSYFNYREIRIKNNRYPAAESAAEGQQRVRQRAEQRAEQGVKQKNNAKTAIKTVKEVMKDALQKQCGRIRRIFRPDNIRHGKRRRCGKAGH